MLYDLILLQRHLDQLREAVLPANGAEGSAYVLCGTAMIGSDPWDRRARQRLLSHAILPVPPEDWVSASPVHVTWSTQSFVRLLKQTQAEGLVAGIVHAHPGGPPAFSDQDDRNESDLMRLAQNRNGPSATMLSILLTGAGDVRSRLWVSPTACEDIARICVVGDRLTYHGSPLDQMPDEAFARQVLAFGASHIARLRTMKIVIVGCGGTGSAVALLLARLGVGCIVLIDEDIVDFTNLNRLHGSRRPDAGAMRSKVEVVASMITEMGLGTRVVTLPYWVAAEQCRDALKSADAVFGCTDDHDGRLFLNRFAYFYNTPVIDIGLAIEPHADGKGVKELAGRSTIIVPGAPCLLCRQVVDPVIAREESLRRQHPEEYERQKKEAYVRGANNPAPAVVTFTTETACMAVNELMQGVTGFRGDGGWMYSRLRRFAHMEDRRPGANFDPHCVVCGEQSYWGRGDVSPFLDRVG
jgi:hypothetical protein